MTWTTTKISKTTISKTISNRTKSTTIEEAPDRRVVLALGGNVGDRDGIIAHFERALRRLAEGPLRELRTAPLYRTAAILDPPESGTAPNDNETRQPDFINTVVAAHLASYLEPGPSAARHLLGWCKQLEAEAGRPTGAWPSRNQPRPLDLDLLLLGTKRLHLPAISRGVSPGDRPSDWPGEIIVPHPRLLRRRFVLRPLADLLPDLLLPGPGRLHVSDALRALDLSNDPAASQTVQRVERIEDSPDWSVGLRERERGTM